MSDAIEARMAYWSSNSLSPVPCALKTVLFPIHLPTSLEAMDGRFAASVEESGC